MNLYNEIYLELCGFAALRLCEKLQRRAIGEERSITRLRISYCKHIVQASPLPSPGERELNNYNNHIKFGINHRNLCEKTSEEKTIEDKTNLALSTALARKFSDLKLCDSAPLRENQRRENQRRENQRRENQRRENQRRENQRRENQRRENQRRENQRRENQRRENQRRENSKSAASFLIISIYFRNPFFVLICQLCITRIKCHESSR